MLGITSRKRGGPLSGENIDRTGNVNTRCIRRVPRALRQSRRASNDPQGNLRGNMDFPPVIPHLYKVPVPYTPQVRVIRVDPQTLRIKFFKPRILVVDRVGAPFCVPAYQFKGYVAASGSSGPSGQGRYPGMAGTSSCRPRL